jgi:hypothetical protein
MSKPGKECILNMHMRLGMMLAVAGCAATVSYGDLVVRAGDGIDFDPPFEIGGVGTNNWRLNVKRNNSGSANGIEIDSDDVDDRLVELNFIYESGTDNHIECDIKKISVDKSTLAALIDVNIDSGVDVRSTYILLDGDIGQNVSGDSGSIGFSSVRWMD